MIRNTIGAPGLVNPQYRYALEDWCKCDDCFAGEREIKEAGETYLPRTEGQMADPQFGARRYEAYKSRANYFNYFFSTAATMLGILHREPPEAIELPERIRPLRRRASSDGLPLTDTLRRLNLLQLIYGRCGVLLDVPPETLSPDAVPAMTLYPAHRILDWECGNGPSSPLRSLLLDESCWERKEGLWSFSRRVRLCALSPDSEYFSVVLTPEEYAALPGLPQTLSDDHFPEIRGRRLRKIPFVFANVTDSCPDVQKPPLLALANLCLAIYRGEADYRHALFMQGQSTLFLKGFQLDGPPMMGAGNYIHTESPDASGGFLEISGAGLQEMRTAQNDLHEMAKSLGLSLDNWSNTESGEALKTRLAVKTALMRAIAETGERSLHHLLRMAAEWCGADPDEVVFRVNRDFSEGGVSASDVLELWNAKTAGLPLSARSIHDWLRRNDFTDASYDEELEQIRQDGDTPHH